MTAPIGTATAAKFFVALTAMSPVPTLSQIPAASDYLFRFSPKTTTRALTTASDTVLNPAHIPQTTSIAVTPAESQYSEPDRSTTSKEIIVGELRSWGLLDANWDGEGAVAPNARSLKEAVAFVGLLEDGQTLPEPMLHSSGHAGLFWNEEGLYADLEFLGDGRFAYYIERQGNKHKGVIKFDSQKMPAVFPALIRA